MKNAHTWKRFIGWMIDFAITFPISWIIHKSELGQTVFYSQMVFMVFEGTYYVLFWLLKSASPGMMAMRIRLFSQEPITFKRAVLRYIGLNISIFCVGLGALWVIWDNSSQTWQDKIAMTYVIET